MFPLWTRPPTRRLRRPGPTAPTAAPPHGPPEVHAPPWLAPRSGAHPASPLPVRGTVPGSLSVGGWRGGRWAQTAKPRAGIPTTVSSGSRGTRDVPPSRRDLGRGSGNGRRTPNHRDPGASREAQLPRSPALRTGSSGTNKSGA